MKRNSKQTKLKLLLLVVVVVVVVVIAAAAAVAAAAEVAAATVVPVIYKTMLFSTSDLKAVGSGHDLRWYLH